MKRSHLALPLALCLVGAFAAGCNKGSLETQVVGQWQGKITMPQGQEHSAAAKAFENAPVQTLEVKADKTFTMTGGMEGTWDIADGKLNLHWTKIMGMDKAQVKELQAKAAAANPANKPPADQENRLDKPIVIAMSGDGKTMTTEAPPNTGAQAAPLPVMTFTKSNAPPK